MSYYPGVYLKTKPFQKRYEIVADYLRPYSKDSVIVDLNCGEPGLQRFLEYKEYHANDIYIPDNIDGINFSKIKDEDVDVKPDILCCFGYGAGEHTGHPMESKTIGDTILRLAEYEPKFIVLEMAQKWEDDFKIITSFKKNLANYSVVLEEKLEVGNPLHYHDKRQIVIFKLNNHEPEMTSDVEFSDN